jgi:glucosamine 6-phosphate synthetase-like amidotransferase/phosphosugar isomerase protein
MQDKIDYLAIERKNHEMGSYNQHLKDLVVAIRHVREGIPATEIQSNMPAIYAMEKKLHQFDDTFGQQRKEYVNEIFDALENEPEPDDSKSFQVCKMEIRDNDEIVFFATGESFSQHIIAEEWIKEKSNSSDKYVIVEVFERTYL